MSTTTTDTGASPAGTTIEDASNAFAAILSGEEPGKQVDSEAPADEADVDIDLEDEEPPEEVPADSEDDEGNDEETPEKPVYTVKVDGEEITVPLEELLAGYSRNQDYTRKTMKLAEERKAAQAEFEAVRQERVAYSQLLGAMQQQIEAASSVEPDWDRLRVEDPIEFGVQWAEHQRQQQKLQAIRAEQSRLAQIEQQQQVMQAAQSLEREKQLLVSAIPEWRNAEKARTERAEIIDYGKRIGFSEQELSSIFDHRAVVALRKAYLYDKALARKTSVKPVEKAAAPVLRPGSANTAPRPASDLTRAKQRLAKSGSVQDAAAAFSLLLGSK